MTNLPTLKTPQKSLAERLFDGGSARSEMEDQLEDAGVTLDRLGYDSYDCSLEIYGVPATQRLSEAAQRAVHAAGFAKVYVNHDDKWETHYGFRDAEFKVAKGWRVSYPHKRGKEEKSIWVEEFIHGWPQEWFDSGYVIIKPAADIS